MLALFVEIVQPFGSVCPVGRVQRVEVGDPLVGAERAARHLELRDVVVVAVAAVDLRLLLAADVPGEAEAGGQLVLEVELDGVLGQGRVRLVAVVRDPLLLGADAEVQREGRVDVPGVLDEEADVRATRPRRTVPKRRTWTEP